MNRKASILALIAAMTGGIAAADEPSKDTYWLLDPVPREKMRDLSPDRPDTTESPITVDAGHLQVEVSFFQYGYDDQGPQRVNAWTIMDTNVKLGITNNMDLQFVFGAYGREETHIAGGPDERLEGFGDMTIRWKTNLWGNDAPGTPGTPRTDGFLEKTAFGVMPFVTIPTGTELSVDEPEGGLITVLSYDVTEHIGLAFMAEFDAVHDGADDRYHTDFIHTATCGFDIVGPLGAFVEYIGITRCDERFEYQALFSSGLTYSINADVLLDVGARIGLTDAAEDIAVFTGITWRY